MKRLLVVGLVALVALAGVSGIAQAQQKFTAKIADILSPDHPHSLTMKFFADRVKERTKGRMEIQVFPAAQLGQTKDLFMGVQTGSIEMAKMPMSFSGEWIPSPRYGTCPISSTAGRISGRSSAATWARSSSPIITPSRAWRDSSGWTTAAGAFTRTRPSESRMI